MFSKFLLTSIHIQKYSTTSSGKKNKISFLFVVLYFYTNCSYHINKTQIMQHKKYCIFPGSSVSKKRLPTNHTFTNHPLSSSLPTEIKPAMVIFIVCCFYGLMPVNISPLICPSVLQNCIHLNTHHYLLTPAK